MDVPGLQEGKEYMFRVKAVNDEGESDPLETDHSILAKDPYGKWDVISTKKWILWRSIHDKGNPFGKIAVIFIDTDHTFKESK